MVNTLITKDQAVRVMGSEKELARRFCLTEGRGELALLHGGAKLYVARIGCVIRYLISGYAADGRDTQGILDALGRGESNLACC